MRQRVLVTEDDLVQREIITDILEQAGYSVESFADPQSALDRLADQEFDLLLTDLRMPRMDGLELLRRARKFRPDMDVVLMTAYASVKTAVSAIKEGAADYLEKPFDKDDLLLVMARTAERNDLRRQNRRLVRLVEDSVAMGSIVGNSPVMRDVFERTRRAVPVNSTVLIQGESGTGKELIARHIHFAGPRARKPFIVVNCAAVPDTLVESELFGHEKGAFTGAESSRAGKFEQAHGGTLFLDEIGDMRLESQAKLLRVLQDGVIERVGGGKPHTVDVRVIVATNRNLRQCVNGGTFREDLYYRLEVLSIFLPPLRDRLEDLPYLVNHFRQKLERKLERTPPAVGPDILESFRRYRWPGNVRELENTLEQSFILASSDILKSDDLPEKFHAAPTYSGEFVLPPGGLVLEDLEQDLIRQALDRSGGRLKEAADLLGLSYKTLQYRLKKHDIDRNAP